MLINSCTGKMKSTKMNDKIVNKSMKKNKKPLDFLQNSMSDNINKKKAIILCPFINPDSKNKILPFSKTVCIFKIPK